MGNMMLASGDEVAITVLVLGAIIAFTWIIADQWRRARVAAYNARLKQMMIERGMSADEIERVIKAESRLDNKKAGQLS